MDKVYIIATNWKDRETNIDMHHFYTPDKAVKLISELVTEDGFRKADPTDDPDDYLSEYYDYLFDENIDYERDTKNNIALHIIDLKKEVGHA